MCLKFFLNPKICRNTTLSVPQKVIFNDTNHVKLTSQFDQMQPLAEAGKVIYVHYTELAGIWQNEYKGEPNIFTYDLIDLGGY